VQLGVRGGEAHEVAQDQAQPRGEIDALEPAEARAERLGSSAKIRSAAARQSASLVVK
jgi:hypothetical protein